MFYDIKQGGERIHTLRVEAGYTQEQLAEILNIDRSFYSRIERGERGCSVDLLVHLAMLFGVSLDYLVLGKYRVDLAHGMDMACLKDEIKKLAMHLEQFNAII